MDWECEILLDGTAVGKANINRSGLYYHFRCQCRFSDRQIRFLRAKCEENEVYLGICVPDGDCFTLSAHIPIKRLGEGAITITAYLRDMQPNTDAISKSEGHPLKHLGELDKAFLHQGQVLIKD